MKVVLLSGGSGKRLFPMSNDIRSKQFLKLLSDDSGKRISMLQRVWGQLKKAGLSDDTYICASSIHSDMIFNQIGDVPFIEEPSAKDTFPAIAISTLYLLDQVCSEDETIVVMPIDPYVEQSFFERLEQLKTYTAEGMADIALMGVQPTTPSSKFGYISIESPMNTLYNKVNSFIEKPHVTRAEQLINEGALWNCGVFAFQGKFLKQWLKTHDYPTSYDEIVNKWDELPKISFDYEVVEKVSSALVIPYHGSWKDLGTWDVMTSELEQPLIGLGIMVDNVDTHVINELHIPIVVAGTRDLVVIATPDGVLVSDKQHSVGVKEYSKTLQLRPMYVERRWGDYRVIEHRKLSEDQEMQVRYIRMDAMRSISYHRHMNHEETWTIVRGTGIVACEEEMVEVGVGSVIKVGRGQWHAVKSFEELEFVEIQRGWGLSEEDIERRFLLWSEIERHVELSNTTRKNTMVMQ